MNVNIRVEVTVFALMALKKIFDLKNQKYIIEFERLGGCDHIEELQFSPIPDIRDRVVQLI